ncbi:MAG: methyltransferase domain-containing protein [Gemmatimonadaceae bacterium]|nr:methyltransferase domain-containing protein [Gemmatimonadaceae bacterium]
MNESAERQQTSWIANASAWTTAVREGQIASRKRGTDAAIIAACVARPARRVLDVGCGEGWLARALAAQGADVVGVDASAPLIAAATAAGGATFAVVDYHTLATSHDVQPGPFDLIVCNFALLDEDVTPLLSGLRARLAEQGRLVVQTVHPFIAAGDEGYVDGWREERFAGFGEGFVAAMPWYFRTIGSWHASFAAAGLAVERVEEPRSADGHVLSLIVELRVGVAC